MLYKLLKVFLGLLIAYTFVSFGAIAVFAGVNGNGNGYPAPGYPVNPAYPEPAYPAPTTQPTTAPDPAYPINPAYPEPAYSAPIYPINPAYPEPTTPAPLSLPTPPPYLISSSLTHNLSPDKFFNPQNILASYHEGALVVRIYSNWRIRYDLARIFWR